MTIARAEEIVLRDRVEYLIEAAVQLFSAIERQIRSVELSLEIVRDRFGESPASKEFEERLISVATSLNDSLEDFARRSIAPNRYVASVGGRRRVDDCNSMRGDH